MELADILLTNCSKDDPLYAALVEFKKYPPNRDCISAVKLLLYFAIPKRADLRYLLLKNLKQLLSDTLFNNSDLFQQLINEMNEINENGDHCLLISLLNLYSIPIDAIKDYLVQLPLNASYKNKRNETLLHKMAGVYNKLMKNGEYLDEEDYEGLSEKLNIKTNIENLDSLLELLETEQAIEGCWHKIIALLLDSDEKKEDLLSHDGKISVLLDNMDVSSQNKAKILDLDAAQREAYLLGYYSESDTVMQALTLPHNVLNTEGESALKIFLMGYRALMAKKLSDPIPFIDILFDYYPLEELNNLYKNWSGKTFGNGAQRQILALRLEAIQAERKEVHGIWFLYALEKFQPFDGRILPNILLPMVYNDRLCCKK
jgi:hypothetical protein